MALACVALIATGCIGDEVGGGTELPAAGDTAELNPWQLGLDEDAPTPELAETRSAEDRRAEVAEPGAPPFAAFDAVIEDWMEEHNVSAGQFALMYEDRLRYERGYGHVDREATEPADTETMFRLASVTKPVTAAIVTMQVEQGLYNWTDPVFCLPVDDPPASCRLPIEPHPANPVEDDRLRDVEVQHLIDHEAGWGSSTDWMLFNDGPLEISEAFDATPPPAAWQTAAFLTGEPLVHEPGEQGPYCNVCFTLAGLVAEAATGAELAALYEAYIFEPLEVAGDIEAGFTLPEERNPREPFYPCQGLYGQGQYEPNETVCVSAGAFSLEGSFLAPGGLIGTAAAVAGVYEIYAEEGKEYSGPLGRWTVHGHTGSLRPGSSSLAVRAEDPATSAGAVQYAALFNAYNGWDDCEESLEDPRPFRSEGECPRHELMRELMPVALTWAEAEHVRGG